MAKPIRQAASHLALLVVLVGACSNGAGEASGGRSGRDVAERDRRDVPVPSVTNPDGSSPHRRTWQQLWRTTPGTPEHRCVDVGTQTDVRSGDFVVGNFAAFIEGWDGTYETSKLYYIPSTPIEGQLLEVVAELLDDAASEEVTFTFAATAWTTSGIPFYATGTVLPVRGRWRLTATAGENAGCVELTL